MKRLLIVALIPLLSSCRRPWKDGDAKLRAGDYLAAYESYQSAKRRLPAGSDAEANLRIEKTRVEAGRELHRRALERVEAGDLNGAVRLLQRANKVDAENAEVVEALDKTTARKTEGLREADEDVNDARERAAEKDWERALPLYDRAIASNPNHILARIGRHRAANEKSEAERLHREGESKLAEKRLETALARFEASREYWPFNRASEASLAGVKQLLARVEELAASASARAQGGKAADSFRSLEEALEIHPYSRKVALARADLLLGLAASFTGNGKEACAAMCSAEAMAGLTAFRDEEAKQHPELADRSRTCDEEARARTARIRARAGYLLHVTADGPVELAGVREAFVRDLMESWKKLRDDARVEIAGAPPAAAAETGPATLTRLEMKLAIDGPVVAETRKRAPLEKGHVTGTRQEPNPEYQRARDAVRQAEEARAPSLAKERERLAATPEIRTVQVRAVHHYAKISVSRVGSVKVSWEIVGEELREEGSEAFEKNTSGYFFEDPRPDLGIPEVQLKLAPDEELLSVVTRQAIGRVPTRANEGLRRKLLERRVLLADLAWNEGDLSRTVELAVDAWCADPGTAPNLLWEREYLADSATLGAGPAALSALCRRLREKLFPPPAGIAALLEASEPLRPTAEGSPADVAAANEEGASGSATEKVPASQPATATAGHQVRLVDAGIRPDPLSRGSEGELYMRYEVADPASAVVEERRMILSGGKLVDGMPITQVFPVPDGPAGRTVESVIYLPVPADGIPAGEYELRVLSLAGSAAESKTVKFTLK